MGGRSFGGGRFVPPPEETENQNEDIIFSTADVSGVGVDSKMICFETGDSADADSGLIKFETGLAPSGTRGAIQFRNGTEGTINHVWTQVDASGSGEWKALGAIVGFMDTDFGNAIASIVDLDLGSNQINNLADPTLAQDAATKNYVDTNPAGANKFLSNLTSPTDVNEDLLPQTNARKLGALTQNWGDAFSVQYSVTTGVSLSGIFSTADVANPDPTSLGPSVFLNGGQVTIRGWETTTAAGGNVTISSGESTALVSGNTSISTGDGDTGVGVLSLTGGDFTGASGSGGDITLEGGAFTGGGRLGRVELLSGTQLLLGVLAADPTVGLTGGLMYYNSATGKFRGYNGVAAAWQDLN